MNETAKLITKDDDAKIEIVPPGSIRQLVTAEVDVQVATAHRYPRSIQQFRHDMTEWACIDEETAASCYYQLRRGGKRIEGPSVRLAEIAATCYGNFRHGSDPVDQDARFVTARGFAWDLQRNVATSCQIKRRITDRNGQTYSDDMIGVATNAACSIAMRNAVFDVVPFALVKPTYLQCVKVSLGEDLTHSQRIDRAIGWYVERGATADEVFAALGKKGTADITTSDLVFLRGQATAIAEGMVSMADALKPPGDDGKGGRRVAPVSVTRPDPKPAEPRADADADADSEPAGAPNEQPADASVESEPVAKPAESGSTDDIGPPPEMDEPKTRKGKGKR